MRFPTKERTALAALLAALLAGPALADKGGHGKGREDHEDQVRVVQPDRDQHRHDERVVQVDPHRQACPPGLAKKHNGCLPPGQANKGHRVVVGEALPPGAVFVVPTHVRRTLPPPPAGYRYAVVDNQVVLVSNRNLVVEIVASVLG